MEKIYLVLERIEDLEVEIKAKGEVYKVTEFDSLQKAYEFVRENSITRRLAKRIEVKIIEQ